MKLLRIALREKSQRNILIIAIVLSVGIPLFVFISVHPQYKGLIVQNAVSDAAILASHLLSEEIYNKLPLHKASFVKEDHFKFGMVKKNFSLYKIKIFSAEGKIVFSTNPSDIGEVNRKDYFHKIVREGNTFTAVVRKNQKSMEGHVVNLDVVSCYVPIMVSGNFSGAFEIYYDVSSKFDAIERLYTKSMIWVLSFSGIIIIFVLITLWFSGKQLKNKECFERMLIENEAMFKSISLSVNDALITIDTKGKVKFWNESAEIIFGYTKDEVVGKELHPLLTPEKYHNAYRKTLKAFASDGNGPACRKLLELSALRKNGEEFPIELSLATYQTENGWHAVGTIRDISDRKKYEQEREKLIIELKAALKDVRQLSGLLPICAHCKKIRDDKGYWNQIESYIEDHSEAKFSHSICKDCEAKYFSDI